MNKKLNIIFLLTLFVSLSCNKSETTPTLPEEGAEIKFENIATKAVSDIIDIEDFEVSIAMTSSLSGADYITLLENERVYRDDTRTGWKYDHTRYWMDGLYYYFVASYSYDMTSSERKNIGAFQKMEADYGYRQVGYAYEVNTDSETDGQNATIDILTAYDYVHTYDDWTVRNVNLIFRHILTKVNFKISQDLNRDGINNYYIKRVKLSGVKNEGTYVITPENGNYIKGWNLNNESQSYYEKSFDNFKLTKQEVKDGETVISSNPLLVWGEDGLLLIPQKISTEGQMQISVDYLHEYVDEDTESDAVTVERNITANIPTSDLWESNKSITYTISIANPNQIIFNDPVVQSWGNAQTGGMIIIK